MKKLVMAGLAISSMIASSAYSESSLVPRFSLLGGTVKVEGKDGSTSIDLSHELNYGVQALFPVAEALNFRTGIALGKAKGKDTTGVGANRTALDAGVEYNFVKSDTGRVYFASLATYNSLISETSTATTINLDVGLGGDYKVADKVFVGGEFLVAPFAISKYSKDGLDVSYLFQDIALFAAIKN